LLNQVTSGDFEVIEHRVDSGPSHTVYYVSNEGDPLQAQVWAIKNDGSGKQKLSSFPGVHEPKFAPASPTYVDLVSNLETPPQDSICHAAECKAFFTSKPLDSGELTRAGIAPIDGCRRQDDTLRPACCRRERLTRPACL
jgi:dipeptidyl-peptidase-4